MKNDRANWPAISYVSAFLIGIILFWSIGVNWLNLESAPVFLAGLIGVFVAVLMFGAWKIRQITPVPCSAESEPISARRSACAFSNRIPIRS